MGDLKSKLSAVIKDLHLDLARKYRIHGPKVETIWKSFSTAQRIKALRDGASNGRVLKDCNDSSMGSVCKMIPEWNLRDLTQPGDQLLHLLRGRATTTLMEQYHDDRDLIIDKMRTRNLRHVDDDLLKDCLTLFLDDDEQYGLCYSIKPGQLKVALAGLGPFLEMGTCVPQTTAELILMRQNALLFIMNLAIEDILEIGSTTRITKAPPPKRENAAVAAMAKLSIQARPTKLSIEDLLASANDQMASLREDLDLLSSEPVVLTRAVKHAAFSRPELVADEKGQSLPCYTDRCLSSAFFDAVNSVVKATAIWDYITRLLDLLKNTTDRVFRAVILQEISNTCHLEYGRTQSVVKRHIQTGNGKKYFRRVSNVYDNGIVRVSMKVKPEELTRSDPQLHYYLRLCHPETTATKAVQWLDKLAKLHDTDGSERERLSDREFAALRDHTIIVSFIKDLGPGISMPPLSRNKGQLFVSRTDQLEGELNQIRDQLDLTDFVVPINNLLEPGIAPSALEALEAAVISKTGIKLGFMYQDMIDDCLADLEAQYHKIKAKVEKKGEAVFVPFPSSEPEPSAEARSEMRRMKEKTRPAHSSVFDFVPGRQELVASATPSTPEHTFKVKVSTAEVFRALFDRSEARGAVSWVSFEAAMADLGFSVVSTFGSVFNFMPSPKIGDIQIEKSVVMHRPHKANIEGWLLLKYASRLNRVYGWDKDTFQVE